MFDARQAVQRAPARAPRVRFSGPFIAGIGLLVLLILGLGAVLTFELARPPASASVESDSDARTGKILVHSDGDRCRQRTFDNQTGRITEANVPCGADAQSKQQGTGGRLNQISKSFTNR
jgi:hypothetical protein